MIARSRRTTTIVLAAALLACVLLLGVTARYLHIDASRMAASQSQAVHTVNMITVTRTVRLAVTDAETAQRGFLLTSDRSYLAPYTESVAALPALMQRLRHLTAADPIQQQRVAALQDLVASKLDEIKQSLAIFDASGLNAAQAFVATNAGRDLMSEIRNLANAIIDTETQSFNARVSQSAASQQHEEVITLSVVGGALLVLVVAASLLFIAFRHSHRAQSVLQATVKGVTRGLAAFENDRLVAWNDRVFELFRLPPDLGKVGTPVSRLEQSDSTGLLFDLSEQLKRARETDRDLVVERTRSDGAIFQLFFSPPHQGIAVFSAFDVTLRLQSERFLQNAQKMDALGHLTGGIAHDFNNLLTVVLMNLEALAQSPVVMEKFGRRVELMTAASQKGAALVRQLLAYARKQPLEPEVINLRDVMPGLVDLIKRTIGEDIDVSLKIGDDLWPTIVDPAKFESAALNLALNARDAMPDGGRLTLELSNLRLDDTYAARHPEIAAGDYVMVAVSDTGSGMRPEVMGRAFDPFFTTKGEGRGTGLGLSMVQGFVKQTGGHIELDSEPGRGTTIRLYFPRCRDSASASPPSSQASVPTGTETILVVEDGDRVRSTTVGVLKELGYDTMQTADGPSALALLQTGKPVDLLFTDIVLSGSVNGPKTAEAAREIQPAIKVLYTSGYNAKAVQRQSQSDPNVGLLNKPYRIDELAATLRDVLTRNLV